MIIIDQIISIYFAPVIQKKFAGLYPETTLRKKEIPKDI